MKWWGLWDIIVVASRAFLDAIDVRIFYGSWVLCASSLSIGTILSTQFNSTVN